MLPRVGLVLLLMAAPAWAAITAYPFDDAAKAQRFHALTEELRCPKCQNQNIADSNAPLAADLRQRVYDMVLEGHSDEDIVNFLVARYGDFITYRPPLRPSTWVLWFGPFVVMSLLAGGFIFWLRGRRKQPPAALSEQDRQRLQALLADSREEQN